MNAYMVCLYPSCRLSGGFQLCATFETSPMISVHVDPKELMSLLIALAPQYLRVMLRNFA